MPNQAPFWYQDYLQSSPQSTTQIDPNRIPLPVNYWYITPQESEQMLIDLQALAKSGCIAAAWALLVFEKLSQSQ
jgi:hypothetical protein